MADPTDTGGHRKDNKVPDADVFNLLKNKRPMGLTGFFRGFRYAFRGLVYAFSTQINFRFQFIAALGAILLGLYMDISTSEWMWICSAILVVLIVELLNTAIEVLVDLVSPGYHPKAGIIKDVSAGAVLLTALFAVVVGLFIFVPKFMYAP
jgi:undecaprenol kinase/diacylglycerol kinase (ATP)